MVFWGNYGATGAFLVLRGGALHHLLCEARASAHSVRRRTTNITHLAGPPDSLLGFGRHTTLHAELVRDPVREQELLDLAVGERIREVTEQTDRKLDRALGALRVGQTPLNELKHGGSMRQEQVDLGGVLEAGDDAGVRLEDTVAQEADVLDEIDVELMGSANQ